MVARRIEMSRLMLIVVMVACVGLFSVPALGQTDVEIPSWVKGIANFWVEDKIDDGEFAEALEFLIDNDIIQLENTVDVSDPVVENPFGIEDETLQKKYDDAVAYYEKQLTDERAEHEKRINELIVEIDAEQAEYIENHRIAEEEKSKLQTEISDLEKEIIELKFKLAEK